MKLKAGITMQEVFFFLVLIGLSVAFYNLLLPFITDIFLTTILVLLFQRPFRFFMRKFKQKKTLAAGLTLVFVSVVVVIPLIFIAIMVSSEASDIYLTIKEHWPAFQKKLTQENIETWAKGIPLIGEHLEGVKVESFRDKINDLIGMLTEFIMYLIQNTFMGFTHLLIHTFVILFLMYYMLIDGDKLIERIQYLIPLNDEDESELFTNLKKVTDAIVINTFMIGAAEGTYGGLLFYFLGVPSPAFWGVLMAALSIIPLVGANSILFPAGVLYLILGDYTTGTLILTLGTGVVLINQNVIRPRLDGNKSGMHTAVVFLASMGGLIWMGIIGFLAGPLIAALFITIWAQFGKKYQRKLKRFNAGKKEAESEIKAPPLE